MPLFAFVKSHFIKNPFSMEIMVQQGLWSLQFYG